MPRFRIDDRTRLKATVRCLRLGIVLAVVGGVLTMADPSPLAAQPIPALAEIPPALVAVQPSLVAQRATLSQERARLHENVIALNRECSGIHATDRGKVASCTKRKVALEATMTLHVRNSEAFNKELERMRAPSAQGCGVDGACTIDAMIALARRLGWSGDDQARLTRSLQALAVDFAPNATEASIRSAWSDILERDGSGGIAAAADRGEGPGFPGAGTQASFQDCAIFAIANATGVPYSVVANRATRLMRDGTWRSAHERADPQHTIETGGLNGGEVIMIAQALGRARVVEVADFAAALKAGSRVLVNVVPRNGDRRLGHEVVLTKTFRHGEQTWYELMDSTQGPLRRLYVSHRELNIIHRENGVAYRPEPGQSPALLR